ncbi:MAG: VWA domain-containing protein [Verrucomicrobiota bacterium]|nr:VWA domain-containing protein [Verrucomicrobiota bacterium]
MQDIKDAAPRSQTPPGSAEMTVVPETQIENLSASGRLAVLLSGLGYYKLSLRRRRQLMCVLAGSLGVHILAFIIWGGYAIATHKVERAVVFKTPPPVRKYEPRKLEHKVKLQKQQRSSSRPSMMPRMVSLKLSNLALPEIKVDPKIIHTTFQPKFKAVSGMGLGAGLGTGYGTHGFGAGVSQFNFFGIHGRGEKIAVLVDVSISMVEEQKGGPEGFERVRLRLNQVVDALNEATMFNVVVFADAASSAFKEISIANPDNKNKAKMFMKGFNTEGNYGLTSGNVSPSSKGLSAVGGTTRLDLALTAAFDEGADTVLIISDGAPKVKKGVTAEQMREQAERMKQWQAENAGAVRAWDAGFAAAEAGARVTSEKVWIPEQPAVPPRAPGKGALKEGAPIDRGDPGRPAIPGHWEVRTSRTGGWNGPPRPEPPKMPDPGFWTLADFIEHLRLLHQAAYLKKGKKPPVIHCIGYQIDKEGHAFLSKLSATYHGKYRKVTTLRE